MRKLTSVTPTLVFRSSLVFAAAVACTAANAQISCTNATAECGLVAVHAPSGTCFGAAQAYMTSGMAVGDFNNDGWPDVFVLGGGLTADKLMINNGDGTFTEQAAKWGIASLHGGFGASVADYNNDGWLDIYVTSWGNPSQVGQVGKHRLYRNDGNGSFTEVAASAGVTTTTTLIPGGNSSGWGDYDLDGDLDLFVTSWKDCAIPHPQNCPGGNAGTGNRLFRNNGDGTFTDVTQAALGNAMMGANGGVWGFTPAFVDMDGDLYPELVIAADFKTSRYLRNNKDGTFSNITAASGMGLDAFGMGQTVADFNNDGRLDWYVTSIFQDSGPPVGYLNGNVLYFQLAAHLYEAAPYAAGVSDGGWGWGALAVDLDNDGLVDIVEVNGRPASGEWANERGYLYRNNGNSTFTEVGIASGFDHVGEGRALAWMDADRDGRQDFLVTVYNSGLLFYRNSSPKAGNFLHLKFNTSNNPRLAPNGYGTRVVVSAGGKTQTQFLSGSPSYLATSELALHFGLGNASVIDQITIYWAKGYVTTLNKVAVNQFLTIQAPKPGDLSGEGIVNVDDLVTLLAAWGPCSVGDPCVADINGDRQVNVDDLVALLSNWG